MGAPIHAGDYRHRITIRGTKDVADGHGGFRKEPVDVCHRTPAFVEPLSGHELVRAQQLDPRSRYGIQMRWHPDISPRQQLIYHARGGDRQFEILSVNDTEELHHELTLLCAEAA